MYSIVIPCFNETIAVVKKTVMQCKTVMEKNKLKYEIIIVDDGSTKKINFKEKCLKIIRHPHNAGYGKSIKNGIENSKYNTIIITDSDSSYPIYKISDLIKSYKTYNYDMVVGARQGKHYQESYQKIILRFILKFLVEYTAGRSIPDINSGLRIFSKNIAYSYFKYLCNTFSFTTSLTLAFIMNNHFVKYIPIPYEKRIGKSKVNLFRDSLRTLQFIVLAIVYYNPIKVFIAFLFFLTISLLILFIVSIISELDKSFLIYFGLLQLVLLIFSFFIFLISIQLKQIIDK